MNCPRSMFKPRTGSGIVCTTKSPDCVAFASISCVYEEITISCILWAEWSIYPNFLSWIKTIPDTPAEKILVIKLLPLCQCPPQSIWVSIMFLQSLAQISAGRAFRTLAVNKWLKNSINLCRRGCLQPPVNATVCNQHADGIGVDWKAAPVSLIFACIWDDNSNKLIKYHESIEDGAKDVRLTDLGSEFFHWAIRFSTWGNYTASSVLLYCYFESDVKILLACHPLHHLPLGEVMGRTVLCQILWWDWHTLGHRVGITLIIL